jgi:hypothetical protein
LPSQLSKVTHYLEIQKHQENPTRDHTTNQTPQQTSSKQGGKEKEIKLEKDPDGVMIEASQPAKEEADRTRGQSEE